MTETLSWYETAHPSLHLLLPGGTVRTSVSALRDISPDLLGCMWHTAHLHYRWTCDGRTVPLGLQTHPEISLWRRHYLVLALYGLELTKQIIDLGARIEYNIKKSDITFFHLALKKLDDSGPLKDRPKELASPPWLKLPVRQQLDRATAESIANGEPLEINLAVYPLENLMP